MDELKKRNLISTVRECLQEHEVQIRNNEQKTAVPMFLVEATALSSLYEDFQDTYKGKASEFQEKLAKKIMGENPFLQKYGLLIDRDLVYRFAFNRRFADIDRDRELIVFKNAEELLVELAGGLDLSKPNNILGLVDEGSLSELMSKPGDITCLGDDGEIAEPSGLGGGGDMVFHYALQGRKEGEKRNPGTKNPEINAQGNLIDRVKSSYYPKNIVNLVLQGQEVKMLLTETPYVTDTFKDFMRTYKGEVRGFKEKLAKKAFGDKKAENKYGIFLTENPLQMAFAFNTAFARYDSALKKVVFTPAEEVLLALTEGRDLSKIIKPPYVPADRIRGRGPVIKYGLPPSLPDYPDYPTPDDDSNDPRKMMIKYSLQGKK